MKRNPILCADDDSFILDYLRCILQDDYPLVFARNGAETLAAVQNHAPALILLDVVMPDMNGFDIARQLKSLPDTRHIPIIFITSLLSEQDEELGFRLGCVDYITKPISCYIIQARVKTHISLVHASQLEASYRAAIRMIGEAGHYNDSDTGEHIWRMADYCHALALAVGWDDYSAELLQIAAPMHDAGKIGIPDSILKKPGKLDETEWKTMMQHPRIGYEILSKSDAPVFKLAAEIALNHHENWDGTGYPNGLAGNNIPESARIVTVADVFDALTMVRPYKDAWSVEHAITTLNEMAGSCLDKRLVDAFIGIMPQILEIKAKWENTFPVLP